MVLDVFWNLVSPYLYYIAPVVDEIWSTGRMITDRGRLEYLEKTITSPTDSYGMTHMTLVPCL